MKKFFSILLALAMTVSVFAIAGCGAKSEEVKFGMGVYSAYSSVKSASEEANGSAEVTHTVAAVILDKDGKIVDVEIDAANNKGEYTVNGEFVAADGYKTKEEKGSDYGMVAYAGSKLEWDEQVDAFENLVKGKTIGEVKALVASDGYYGTDDVISAGCTIGVSDFVKAVEKACANATVCTAGKVDLELGVVSFQKDCKNASEEADGVNEIDTIFAAALVGEDDKVVVMTIDSSVAKFTFNVKGEATLDATTAISTKNELGENYNMSKYGADLNGDGVVKEWNEQAAALANLCVGKTASEIAGLAIDTGYGSADVQTAGCTIKVSEMVEAAVKAVD